MSRRVRRGLLILVVVLITFEVVVRHLPPDGVTYTHVAHISALDGSGNTTDKVTMHTYTAPQQSTTIDAWNHALNTAPISPVQPFLKGCEGLSETDDYTVVMTWHGLPVQVWTAHNCPSFSENSGGIPNLFWTRFMATPDQAQLLN